MNCTFLFCPLCDHSNEFASLNLCYFLSPGLSAESGIILLWEHTHGQLRPPPRPCSSYNAAFWSVQSSLGGHCSALAAHTADLSTLAYLSTLKI